MIMTGNDYESYTWNCNNNDWNIFPVTETGQYIVEAVDEIGCDVVDTIVVTVDECLGLDELSANAMTVYPNPTNGVFTVDLNTTVDHATLSIVDLQGKVCYTAEIDNGTSSKTIDASQLENGVYILSIETNEFQTKTQIVVAK